MRLLQNGQSKTHKQTGIIGSYLCFFVLATIFFKSCSSSNNTIKVGLLIDNDTPADLPNYFSTTIVNYNEKGLHQDIKLKAVVLKWDEQKPPIHNIKLVEADLLQANVSFALSFLNSENNEVFCDLIASTELVLINLQSECLRASEDLVLSMLPSEELLAAATRNIIMEFDHSRFTCITTITKKDDPFWTHFFDYVHDNEPNNTHTFPKCLILKEFNDINHLRALLAAVRTSGVKIIILHAESVYVDSILEISQQLSLQNIGKDIIWVLTDMTTRIDPYDIPVGTIGIAKAFNTSDNHTNVVSGFDGLDKMLVDDSVVLIWRALSRLSSSNSSGSLQEMFGLSRHALYREILDDSFTGKTGLIQFSSVGQRITYDFIITRFVKETDESKHWNQLGRAPTSRRKNIGPSALTAFIARDLPKPRHLRIVTIIHSPFTMAKYAQYSNILGTSCDSKNSVLCKRYTNTTSTERINKENHESESFELLCCYGIMIDILLLMEKQTGFTYELYVVRDGKFGSFDEKTQQMNGMVGDVYRGEADMALATLTITRDRYNYVTFTAPYMGTSLAFLVKRQPIKKYPFPESLQDMRLMKPFSIELWLACGGTFLTVSTTVFLIEKIARYRKGKSVFFLPFEYLAYVFGNIFHVPLTCIHAQSFAVPCLMVWVNFGGLVLISSYTANLLVSLIVVDEVTIVKGIEDERLVNPSAGFTFGTIKYSSTEDYFRNSAVPRLNRIYENMKDNGVHNFSDGINKVKTGELSAFIGESDALQYIIDEDPDCGLKIDGKQIDLAGLAFALRKDSEWEQEITKVVYQLNMKEEISKAFERWTIRSCTTGENKVVPYRMGLDEFGGFLFNAVLFCIGCFLILGIEVFFYRRITRTRQTFTIKPSESVATLVTSVSTQAIAYSNNETTTESRMNGHVIENGGTAINEKMEAEKIQTQMNGQLKEKWKTINGSTNGIC